MESLVTGAETLHALDVTRNNEDQAATPRQAQDTQTKAIPPLRATQSANVTPTQTTPNTRALLARAHHRVSNFALATAHMATGAVSRTRVDSPKTNSSVDVDVGAIVIETVRAVSAAHSANDVMPTSKSR